MLALLREAIAAASTATLSADDHRAALTLCEELAHTLRARVPASSSSGSAAGPPEPKRPDSTGAAPLELLTLPPELVLLVLAKLPVQDLAHTDCVCSGMHGPPRPRGMVEQTLRFRAAEAGRSVPATLPAGEACWTQALLWHERRPGATAQLDAGGNDHSAFINAERRLLTCGVTAATGQPAEEELSTPRIVDALQDVAVKAVACGAFSTLVLSDAGVVYSCGIGEVVAGALGHGGTDSDLEEVPRPIAAMQGVRVSSIAAGTVHSLLLTDSGAVFSCGDGTYGGLGLGDELDRSTPQQITALQGTRVTALAAGSDFSLVVTADGRLFSFGCGEDGQLGLGDENNQLLPVHVGGALADEVVVTVAAGAVHSLAVTSHGALFSFGRGEGGRLGHGDEDERLVPTRVQGLQDVHAIAAGAYPSLAVTTDGRLFSWGYGRTGALGHGDRVSVLEPQQVSALANVRVAAIGAGADRSFAVVDGGRVFGWGRAGPALGLEVDDAFQLTPLEHPGLRVGF